MNKHLMLALVSATLLTAAIASALPLQDASATASTPGPITEETTCEGPGNSCDSQGNAREKNKNIEEECVATNPGGNEPGGHNPC